MPPLAKFDRSRSLLIGFQAEPSHLGTRKTGGKRLLAFLSYGASMLYHEEMSGHDAHLEEVSIDVIGCTVTLKMSAYPDAQAPERIPIAVMFGKVESVQTVANLKELGRHHFAGHLAYWEVAKTAGTSYFYLAAGCLSVTAKAAPTLTML
ncbi:hypothetical protein [Sphingomonas panacis]|uniref:hypothetical protein n=1 Tax=Sphingomonas panacis TaxID=1560345 RepID=UPI00123741EE|nr:hypothetical protein [Sphingomonas panacis]